MSVSVLRSPSVALLLVAFRPLLSLSVEKRRMPSFLPMWLSWCAAAPAITAPRPWLSSDGAGPFEFSPAHGQPCSHQPQSKSVRQHIKTCLKGLPRTLLKPSLTFSVSDSLAVESYVSNEPSST